MTPPDSRKKRKLSELGAEQSNVLISALAAFQDTLDEDDEDLPSELIPALDKLRRKLAVGPHTSFSKADQYILSKVNISPRPLSLREDKRQEIVAIGMAEIPGALSFDTTVELVQIVRNHVSLSNEAGCRILIDVLLLRLVSTMQTESLSLNILPEFPIPKTILEEDGLEGFRSFSGVLDFLLASVPPQKSPFLLEYPFNVISDPANRNFITPAIIEAKKNYLNAAVPQAAVAAASYCKQNSLPVIRGCITSGEEWIFFIYKASDGVNGKGIYLQRKPINLGTDMTELPLILGLLTDLVKNALKNEQNFFSYGD